MQHKQTYYTNSRTSEWTQEFKHSNNYTHVCVLKASVPKSYYLIDEKRNTFTLTEAKTDTTITLSAGNYNITTFATLVKNALNASSPNHWSYNCTSSTVTGKYTFTVSGNDSQPSFSVSHFVNEQLGFPADSVNTFVDSTLVSTYVVNMQLENTLYIHSDMVGSDGDNVICELYSSVSDYSPIVYNCDDVTVYSKKIIEGRSSFIFWLTDENGQVINLNGQNIVMTIMFFRE